MKDLLLCWAIASISLAVKYDEWFIEASFSLIGYILIVIYHKKL